MSRTPIEQMRLLEKVDVPEYAVVVEKANEWMARTGTGAQDLASRLGLGHSTLNMFLQGRYGELNGPCDTRYISARLWPFILQRWPKEEAPPSADLLETKSYRLMRERLEEAVEEGINALVYGPPSSEKSFVLENLCAQFRAAGKPALYVYCGPNCTPTGVLRAIAQAAEVWVRTGYHRVYTEALRSEFCSRPAPPAIVLDEAQHLDVDALEAVRELHDRTRRGSRKGCGIILAGSHNLFRDFMHPARKPRLEQWLSRLPKRIQLEGMTKDEILRIAARAWGNGRPAKLSEENQKKLLERCTVEDPYAVDSNLKSAPRTYYSSRRLLEYIRQQKKDVRSVLAEEVA